MTVQCRLTNRQRLAPVAALLTALAPALMGPATAQGYGPNPTPTPAPAPAPAAAAGYKQVNLVSDQFGVAIRTDPNLVNPWGISFGPGSPFWVANNGKGNSTLYQQSGDTFPAASAPLVVTIPPPAGSTGTAAPTGTVFNGTAGFALAPGKPALFLFATEDGTISGWSPSVDMTHAILRVNRSPGAVYKGLALLGSQLYAANFRANRIDIFNSDFSPAGSFTDSSVPAGYAPFGIQAINNTLYVTYALQDRQKHDDVPGPGHGYVDTFDPRSHKFTRLISGGKANSPLNSPWGVALAPAGFGPFSGQLLVGNFGGGRINAFDPRTGAFRGPLAGPDGKVIAISGLWGLTFASGPNNQPQPPLFFTAGPGGEQHGLFGRLDATN
jgi:uncharacterized protein (TIGR03118 family)